MFSSKSRTIFLSGLLVVLAACSPAEQGEENNTDAPAEIVSLEGSKWQLVELTVLGGFTFQPNPTSDYNIFFRSNDRLTGRSDCNDITGSWFQGNTSLRLEPFAVTRALCAPGSLHNNLALYMKDVDAYSIQDGHLMLTTPTEGILIEFEPAE